jgi:hypothetical protein
MRFGAHGDWHNTMIGRAASDQFVGTVFWTRKSYSPDQSLRGIVFTVFGSIHSAHAVEPSAPR